MRRRLGGGNAASFQLFRVPASRPGSAASLLTTVGTMKYHHWDFGEQRHNGRNRRIERMGGQIDGPFDECILLGH